LISDNLRGAIYMGVAMAAFTLGDTAIKLVTETVPLFQTIALRGGISVTVLVVLALRTGAFRLPDGPQDRRRLGLRTVAEILATLLFMGALMHMPLANLSAILQTLPLAVTLGAALAFREPIGWRRLLAIFVGFCGVLLIIRPGSEGFDIWSVVGLGSVACVVVRDLVTRRMTAALPSVVVALAASLGVALMGLAGTAVTGWALVGLREAALIGFAALALIVGYLSSVKTMRVGEIGFVAPFRYTALIWAILLGWAVFGTLPDVLTLTGAAVVIGTGIFTLYRERRIARALSQAG
jgi:drug/metabolite transporter (DMT)-like permease